MKKIIILFVFFTYYSYSQQNGLLYYGYIESLPNGAAKGSDYNAYLIFNKEMSNYITAKDSLEKTDKIYEEKISYDEENNVSIVSRLKVSEEGDQVVYHIRKKTMWSNFLFKKQIYVKEVTPIINWKISKETKKIGKFNCKKATANFRGRDYTAWFTMEIALPFGPWKLNGLPGLILEAYDANKHVYQYFKNIEYPSKTKEKVRFIKIPKSEKFKDYSEFKIFQKQQIEKNKENQKMINKEYPNVVFGEPKIENLFIECE